MNEYKILFSGMVGAGKTTAIRAVSEAAPLSTDVANSDSAYDKAMTTVGLDFGLLTLASGDRLRLFGTPGQARFDFMWRILANGAIGIVLLIDNSRPDPLADLDVYLQGFQQALQNVPCVVGVGRMETPCAPSLAQFSERVAQHGLVLPILPVDVRQRDDVVMLIDLLLTLHEVAQEPACDDIPSHATASDHEIEIA
jgi:uncharacterized protein